MTYRKIFRKYIPRVLAALVLFSVVFQIFDDATGESSIQFKTILYGLQNAVTGSGWKHMWYLYLITALYLLLPFYRKIAASLNSKDTYYLLSVYLVFLSLLPMLQTLTEKSTAFYICVYSVYPFIFSWVMLLCRNAFAKKPWLMILLASVGTIAVACLTILSEKSPSPHCQNFLPVMHSVDRIAVCWNFRADVHREKKAPKVLYWILHQIDQCSFGVYLIHMLFLKLVLVVWKWNSLYAWRIFYDPGTFRWNVSLLVPVYSVAEICSNTEKKFFKAIPYKVARRSLCGIALSLKKRFDYQKRVSQMRYSFLFVTFYFGNTTFAKTHYRIARISRNTCSAVSVRFCLAVSLYRAFSNVVISRSIGKKASIP